MLYLDKAGFTTKNTGTFWRDNLVLAGRGPQLGHLLSSWHSSGDGFLKKKKRSHVSLHVKSQVVRAREGTLAQVTLERPVSGVLPEVPGQLV